MSRFANLQHLWYCHGLIAVFCGAIMEQRQLFQIISPSRSLQEKTVKTPIARDMTTSDHQTSSLKWYKLSCLEILLAQISTEWKLISSSLLYVNNEATCKHFKDKFFVRNFRCDSFRNLTIYTMRRNSIYLDGAVKT